MTAEVFPHDLCNVTLSVDCFFAALVFRTAFELVTFSIENRFLVDNQGAFKVPIAGFAVFNNFSPDFVGLCLSGEFDVRIIHKLFSVSSSGGNNCGEKRYEPDFKNKYNFNNY